MLCMPLLAVRDVVFFNDVAVTRSQSQHFSPWESLRQGHTIDAKSFWFLEEPQCFNCNLCYASCIQQVESILENELARIEDIIEDQNEPGPLETEMEQPSTKEEL